MPQMATKLQFALCILFFAAASLISSATSDIDEKVANFHEMTRLKGIVRVNHEKFDLYVRQRPRNYSVIAMTTALNPQRGCAVCAEAFEEYKILYDSYRRNNNQDFVDNKVFFILVDYDEAAEVFQSLKLNSAPGFFHFPGSEKKASRSDDKLDIQRKGYQATILAKWVADRTGVAIEVVRPPSYAGLLIIVGVIGLITLMAFATGFNFDWLKSTKLWATIAIFVVLTMTSGQMWNHIRGPPPMGRAQGNRMAFIADGSQMQYIFETYWVFVMYGITSYGVILLGDKAGDTTIEGSKRKMYGIGGVILFVLFYSLALQTFRAKYQGYPYKLLF